MAYYAQHSRYARHICRVEPRPGLAAVSADDSHAGLDAVLPAQRRTQPAKIIA
jgi:hypothetical protein